eukprot:TRINITY_DN3539_c0_g3_i1.p1 TRINITY_DN3539_c0_g3~~TRINITY_DN3539_c0_g3_i1.p1  ORF type:complete len:614 (-),score=79.37 TRINITY_DN3539_c0_g3_i1:204-2045(-)
MRGLKPEGDSSLPSPRKYQKARGLRYWHGALSMALRRSSPRWRIFFSHLGFICLFAFLSRGVYYKNRLWHEPIVTGENLLATPWQMHNDTIKEGSFWDKLGRVRRTAGCLGRCPPPLEPAKRKWEPEEFAVVDGSVVKKAQVEECPLWFQLIHLDLQPWRDRGGITPSDIQSARSQAAFRVTIVRSRLHVTHFYKCPESRALFTLWGIAQLLRRFPGQVPDVDFMFDCSDRPRLPKSSLDLESEKEKDIKTGVAPPPPVPNAEEGRDEATGGEAPLVEGGEVEGVAALPLLLRYSGSENHTEVVFPDWTIWGWPEANVAPWEVARGRVVNSSTLRWPWRFRKETGHWRGHVGWGALSRVELLHCHETEHGTVEIEALGQQDGEEMQVAPKYDLTQLTEQACGYRYKIFPDQAAGWSVGLKYFLACGSVVLLPLQPMHDFFSRALQAGVHYWPIQRSQLCSSIRFGVEYGKEHDEEAQQLGGGGQRFVKEDLAPPRIYEYMLHLFQEYAELQTFQPKVPKESRELCPEVLLCLATPEQRKAMEVTAHKRQQNSELPCDDSPDAATRFDALRNRSREVVESVALCEKKGWKGAKSCQLPSSSVVSSSSSTNGNIR